MASNLFTISSSGIKAARAALDITAQNIANAGTEGYVRRSLNLAEMASSLSYSRVGDLSLSGVRVDTLVRNADLFRQAEVRRTGADAQRASTELGGLQNIEAAVEQAGVYPAMTAFETSLSQLAADPTNTSLRAAALEDARTLTKTFNIASQSLDTVGEGLRFEASDGINQINLLSGELARVNLQLTRATPGSSDQAKLLDSRDNMLQQLSQYGEIKTTIASDQTVEVRLGDLATPALVAGGNANTLAMATDADGLISLTLGGSPVTLSSGSLAGQAQALTAVRDNRATLNGIADDLIAAANGAQATGAALDGSAGQPFFSGSGAAGIALALTSGSLIATAPLGAAPNSRDSTNLAALRGALDSHDISGQLDSLLFTVSSAVAGSKVTSDALSTIASSAKIALSEQAGVDLDQEAVNLVRYQQAFQANGKAMQVASDLFDTLLALK
ncbi:flagellar hook-associated protein FlgK [Novosphingobium sp.]|uniref:flagellar hook-associated protein FlgK n=1 Tax=Novosphingobium sp. TaxID=1874826 RepID=UPI0035AF726E